MNQKLDRERRRRGLVDVTVWVPAHKTEAVRRLVNRMERRQPIRRAEVLDRLKDSQDELARFGVEGLSLFGSVSRDEAQPKSDVDLLVEFKPGRPSGLFEMIDLKRWLEGRLGHPADLVTPSTLKPRLKGRILREAIRIF
jgi:predicted nucleotidyltransferase